MIKLKLQRIFQRTIVELSKKNGNKSIHISHDSSLSLSVLTYFIMSLFIFRYSKK